MKPALALLTASLALAAHGLLLADTSGRSLTDVRKQINSGTWPGITLIEAGPKTQPPTASASAPAAPAAPAAQTSAPATPAAGAPAAPVATVPATEPAAVSPAPASSAPSFGDRLRGWLGEPLSGQSMQEAKRLDSPSSGIPLPTAAAGAASAPATPTR